MIKDNIKKWYFITVILSACSIIYELLLATALSNITGSYVWWHSWTIAFYIAGLGLGSYLANKKDSHKSFINIELYLSLLGMGSLLVIYVFHGFLYTLDTHVFVSANGGMDYKSWNLVYKILFFIVSQSLVLVIGSLSGFEIPLIMKRVSEESKENLENKIIAYNYGGTLVGTLVFTFLLYPFFNLITVGIIVGVFNLLVCMYLLLQEKRKTSAMALWLIIVPAIIAHVKIPDLEQVYYKTRYFYGQYIIDVPKAGLPEFLKDQKRFPTINRIKSLYQNIDLFTAYNDPEEFKMFLDSNFQFSTRTERLYHEGFAHLPINLTQKVPKKILVLGAGDGMLIRELLKYEGIESIRHIELDGKVYEMFKNGELAKLNGHSLSNPKVNTLVGDGFYFVRNTKEKFDAIFIDFPYPKTYDLSRLYSIEFYKNVYRILNDKGFVVLDAPLYDRFEYSQSNTVRSASISHEDQENNNVIMSTLYYAGFKSLNPYKVDDETFLMLQKEKQSLSFEISPLYQEYAKSIGQKQLSDVRNQKFPYEIETQYINSIFFPKLVDSWTLAPSVW